MAEQLKVRRLGIPTTASVERQVKHPFVGGIGFEQAPSESEMKTLTEAGFE